MKRKFPVLDPAPEIKLKKQVHLFYALCALWNFIRTHKSLENLFDDPDEERRLIASSNTNQDPVNVAEEDSIMKYHRDNLSTRLWMQSLTYNS
jgi:hypothetical protein